MDPAKMKVVDLRSELGALGLDTKGNKPALVERLKKALESKTGKLIPDSSILDTSTEEGEESDTPRRAGPAARTRRRSSSTRLMATPAKGSRHLDEPESIDEESESSNRSGVVELDDDSCPSAMDTAEPQQTSRESPRKTHEVESLDDESKTALASSDEDVKQKDEDSMDTNEEEKAVAPIDKNEDKENNMESGENAVEVKEEIEDEDQPPKQLTEEEEWEELNERLKIKEKERAEREKAQQEEDNKKLEEVSDDPVKLQRLLRKKEKKSRWNNFYRTVEHTQEVLTPPTVEDMAAQQPQPLMIINLNKPTKQEAAQAKKVEEPEINEYKITLSWYDSDLNQHIEQPDLTSVIPMSDGALAHAWAGARASHGVSAGRVCYEVRVGALMSTTEENTTNGLRIGWSTEDASLHLGEDEFGWGYESSGEVVNNSQYKEYGRKLEEKDVVGVYLDMESSPCKMSYTVNGKEFGVAYEFDKESLNGKALFPHVLTKNYCYKVNFGYERYNMLTKTKTVRNKVEVPVELVLEEKKAREAELRKIREEAKAREKERLDKIRKEREERQRKKREERERVEKEKKEKEAARRKEEGIEDEEEEPEGEDKKEKEDGEKETETEKQDGADKSGDQAMDTGETKAPEEPPQAEPMQTDSAAAKDEQPKVKSEPDAEKDTPVPEVTEEQVLSGITLDKRVKFVTRYTVEEVLDGEEACLLPGYILIAFADLVPGPQRPKTNAECEVILMVGMPGAGKTYWARQYAAEHPEKKFNIISTGTLFDKMKVNCKPFRSTYEGRWDGMISKGSKCVLKLLEIAQGRRRNYIMDQTNVYPSAQRRKLREFDGYRRIAVVVVPDQATHEERQKRKQDTEGKEVPDGAIMDMKANFSLPEKGQWLDEVLYSELPEAEAREVVEAYQREAKAAGVAKEKEKREKSPSRDGPPNKRARNEERRGGGGGGFGREDRRGGGGGRDRDRWGGGGGGAGGRWGGGGRGGRDSSRDSGGRWGGPPSRFDSRDRWSRGGNMGGNDFGGNGRDNFGGGGRDNFGGGGGNRDNFGGNRDGFGGNRDGFGGRGGRGGQGRGGGMMGPRNDRGGQERSQSFDRNNRQDRRTLQPDNKRNQPNMGGAAGGGAGSWQRGSQLQAAGGGGPQGAARGPGQRPQTAVARNNAVGKNDNQNNQNNQGNQQQNQNSGWGNNWGNWGQWGNWGGANQGQAGWGNWNWNNWGANSNQNAQQSTAATGTAAALTGKQQSGGAGGGAGAGAAGAGTGAAGGAAATASSGQWPANYQQQWYQWQQWQQQQQQWSGYQGNQAGTTPDQQQQLWAQYYQNYGTANNTGTASNQVAEKK